MNVKITIPGRPVPKARPRPASNRRGYIIPARTMAYQRQVGWVAKQQIKTPFAGDVEVTIVLYFRGGRVGDVDNYQKSILDGLNGIAFEDDRQVRKVTCERLTSADERAEIEIEEVAG